MSADDHECNLPRIDLEACVRMFGVCCSYDVQRLTVLLAAILSNRENDPTMDPVAMLSGLAENVVEHQLSTHALSFVNENLPFVIKNRIDG